MMAKQDIYETLGKAVRHYRLKYGWTQEELGERTGLHPSYIGQIERATKKISLLTLQKLSIALKVKTSGLLIEKEVKYRPSTWEKKLAGIIRDKPAEYQHIAYRLVKQTLKSLQKP